MDLRKVNDYTWEIPRTGDMKVPAYIYVNSQLLPHLQQDKTLQQARNMACLKGIQRAAYVMPDAHQGYGFPIGGVAAFDLDEGIISPGGVGYDINCGVRLLKTEYHLKDIQPQIKKILNGMFQKIPSGVGKKGALQISGKELEEVCVKGAEWIVENGYGVREDLLRTEEYGRMKGAEPRQLSKRARERGIPQLGTLGAGNHFLEIQKVGEIYDSHVAETYGIHSKDQILVMIHCGSRGLGHQTASDYIRMMENLSKDEQLPDRELINAPVRSTLGDKYYSAMKCAVNYAFANRQLIAHWVRQVFKNIMGHSEGMNQVYGVCHNVAKIEKHEVNGRMKNVCVHRKGATRSFGPGRVEIPEVYRSVGQPVIIPGSMGTASYVLMGTTKAEKISFGSTAHGSGRLMSRKKAKRQFRGEAIKKDLKAQGVELQTASWKGVAEEASGAYKNIEEVVKTSHALGIGKLVARLIPVGVIKG
ncbi:RtcB family protein [bacterium]|nr:RtcB family protein [bacterium]